MLELSFVYTYRQKATEIDVELEGSRGTGIESGQIRKSLASIMDVITVVNGPLDVIATEDLLLPEEYYSVFNMNSTESARLSQMKQLLRSSELTQATKDSIILILAVFNMHTFGVFGCDPTKFLEHA